MEEIILSERPKLHQPYLIIGFEGWPNAAEVSSTALGYLIEHLKGRHFASIPLESFYQLSSLRPVGIIKEGRLVELKFPKNQFYYSKISFPHDVILFQGIEPHLRWTRFVELLLNLAEEFGVSQIITLGGTYDYIPHTQPPLVSALFNHEDLRERVIQAGLGLTDYVGPISIHTFILEASKKRGLKAVSLWGHAPQYLQTKNVKVVYAVLRHLMNLTKIEMDFTEIEKASDYFDQQVNDLVRQDPKLQEVIDKLEEAYQRMNRYPSSEKEEKSKEEKVVYLQAFFKRQEDEEKKGG
ncbi:MAG: PAC2 family protein [Thermodesulfobacteriota bacterium]